MSLTPEEKIERLWDTEQCRKLMARYEYYGYGRVWEKVPGMFAKRDDIWIDCEGFGVFDGPKGIETFFVDWHHSMEGDAKGMLTLHTLPTECIEVAEDGQTARGLWISPGSETRHHATEDRNEAFWIWGLYAEDFIKEDGEWKFWLFRIPHLGESLIDLKLCLARVFFRFARTLLGLLELLSGFIGFRFRSFGLAFCFLKPGLGFRVVLLCAAIGFARLRLGELLSLGGRLARFFRFEGCQTRFFFGLKEARFGFHTAGSFGPGRFLGLFRF